MSWHSLKDPQCTTDHCPQQLQSVIIPRAGDIGNFEVRRALPSKQQQMVGPFIFWDQMGPGEFLTGRGLDVRPHPHIGLATLTYLFAGEVQHRDSLGTNQIITPGAVNLMHAGQGITHSERSPETQRQQASELFGIQAWLALPKNQESSAAEFTHIDDTELPKITDKGFRAHLVAGELFGQSSPLVTSSATLFADIKLQDKQSIEIPSTYEERAIYTLTGEIEIGASPYPPGQLLILSPQQAVTVKAKADCRFIVLGGDAMDGPRHIWWNFVSSDKEKIEEAKRDWMSQRFDSVPGDAEFIPLPKL